jgi:hypothetical protein
MKLFRQLILRPLCRDLTRTVLALLSIESSLTTLVGKVDLRITANATPSSVNPPIAL